MANWDSAQTVTVTGVDDNIIDGNINTTITMAVVDASSDDNFDDVANQTVTATTTDDDSASFTLGAISGTVSEGATTATFTVVLGAQPDSDVVISVTSGDTGEATVSAENLTFTNGNWNTPQTVTVTGVDDNLIDGSVNTTITMAVVDASSDNNFDALADQTVTVTTTDNDTAAFTLGAISGTVTEAGSTATFTVVLGAQPDSDVVISVTSGDTGEATVSPATLTFTNGNWNSTQTVTVTGVDDNIIDGNINTTITMAVVDNDSDDNFDGVANQTVTVTTTDNDTAAFTLGAISGTVTEAGSTATFTVVLGAQPDSDVVISVTSGDTGEATVSPATLTFTNGNWNSTQTVTVTGVDDNIIDGNINTTITMAVVDASSDDNFDDVANQTVTATTVDDDSASFTLGAISGTVSEGATTATFTVVLGAQPDSDVVISVTSGDTGEATVSAENLTFTTANWDSAQTVTVTGVDDTLADGSQSTTITMAVVDNDSDDNFDALADQTVTVTTTDNDTAGFTLSKTDAIVTNSGGTDTFTVVLDVQPVGNVVIDVASSNTDEVTVSATSLTFTTGNWDTPQTITVTGVNGATVSDSTTTTITMSVNDGSSEDNYDAVANQTVSTTFTIISAVTQISTPTNDATPSYVFTTNKTGTVTTNIAQGILSGGTVTSTGNNTVTFNTLPDGTYAGKTITFTDAANNAQSLTLTTFVVDTTAPTIASVTSTTNDGSYNEGDEVNITVNFSEAVTLAGGNLVVTLETGSTDRTVTIETITSSTSASGTYTVQAGDTSSDLTVSGIALSAGSLSDTAGNAMSSFAIATNLAASSALVIDTTAPTIASVTSTTNDGSYNEGDEVNITVNFSEAVTLAGGNLVVTLETGSTDRTVTIETITSSTSASGTYTVQAGDTSSDLTVSGIALSAGSLSDTAGNAMSSFAIATNLAASSALVIDTTAPTITSVTSTTNDGSYKEDDTVNVTVNFSEAVTLTGGNLVVTLETGATDRTVTITSITSSTSASGTYTVQAGDTSSDLTVSGIALSAGSLSDTAGNAMSSFAIATNLAASSALVIDTTAPTVSNVTSSTNDGTYNESDSISIQVTFSETVSVTGTPTLTLENGNSNATASYSSGSGSNELTFAYTVGASDTSADLDYVATNSLSVGTQSVTVHGTTNEGDAPVSLTAPAGATFTAVNFASYGTPEGSAGSFSIGACHAANSQSVVEGLLIGNTGTITIPASNGTFGDPCGGVSKRLYISATYTMDGSIKDAAGNSATLTLSNPGAAGSLGANKALVIDTTAPTITNVTSSTNDGTYVAGQQISIQVTFSETVTVSGTPQLTLETGSDDAVVNYASGSGSNELTFTYTISAGENSSDLDYKSTSALALNSGTIVDGGGNNATLTLASPGAAGSLGANKAIVIDTTGPSVTGVTSSDDDGAYKNGDTITVLVAFDDTVTVDTTGGTPTLLMNNGSSGTAATYTSGTGSNTLTFTYSVGASDNNCDLDYASTSALSLNSGTIKDSAGNNATLTLPTPGASGSISDNQALVVDNTAPTASAQNITVSLSSEGSVTITPAQVDNSSSDNCDSDLTLAINIANYNCSHVGQTNYVLLSATDDAGNTSYAFSTVTVLDATPPTISLNGANPVTVELFSSYTELGATASDTCDDSLPSVTIDNSSVDTNTVGSYTVTYNLDDASGNSATQVTRTVNVTDTTAPSAFTVGDVVTSGGTVVANYLNSTNSNVIVTVPIPNDASISGGTLQIRAKVSGGAFENIGSSASISSVNTNQSITLTDDDIEAITGYAEGATIVFTAVITDASGNSTTGTQSSTTLLVDQVVPSVSSFTMSDTALISGETSTVTLQFSEAVANFSSSADITVQNGSLSTMTTANNITWTGTFTPSSDVEDATNVLTLATTYTDTAGNPPASSTATANYTVDTTAPSVTSFTISDSAMIIGDTPTVTIVFSEAVTGFSSNDDVTVQNGSLAAMTSEDNITWTGTFTPSSDVEDATNVMTLGTSWTDAGGNAYGGSSTTTANYAIDTVRPTVASFTMSDTALISGETSTVTLQFSEAVASFSSDDDITVQNGSLATMTSSDNITWTGTFTPSSDVEDATNVLTLATSYTDTAGNAPASTSTTANYTVDTTAATVAAFTVSDTALKIGDTATVTLQFSEAVSGFSSDDDVTVQNGSLSTMTTTDNITWTGTFTPSSDVEDATNVMTLATSYTDTAGNAGPGATTANYAIDTVRPTVASFTMSDTALISGETSTVTLQFSEAVASFSSDDDITVQNGSLATMTSSDNITWTGTFTPSSDVEDATNVLTLATSYTDTAGNAPASTSTTANYTIDSTTPTIAAFTVSDTALKIGDTATVTLQFSEAVSGFSSDDDVTVQNGSLATMTSSDNITWTGTFTPSSDVEDATNVMSLGTDWTDTAGNSFSTATTITIRVYNNKRAGSHIFGSHFTVGSAGNGESGSQVVANQVNNPTGARLSNGYSVDAADAVGVYTMMEKVDLLNFQQLLEFQMDCIAVIFI